MVPVSMRAVRCENFSLGIILPRLAGLYGTARLLLFSRVSGGFLIAIREVRVNKIKLIPIALAVWLAPTVVRASQSVDARLDYAANGLTFATSQLVRAFQECKGDAHIT